jgi:hypothetical protein
MFHGQKLIQPSRLPVGERDPNGLELAVAMNPLAIVAVQKAASISALAISEVFDTAMRGTATPLTACSDPFRSPKQACDFGQGSTALNLSKARFQLEMPNACPRQRQDQNDSGRN